MFLQSQLLGQVTVALKALKSLDGGICATSASGKDQLQGGQHMQERGASGYFFAGERFQSARAGCGEQSRGRRTEAETPSHVENKPKGFALHCMGSQMASWKVLRAQYRVEVDDAQGHWAGNSCGVTQGTERGL